MKFNEKFIGGNIRKYRKLNKMSQAELAEILGFNNVSSISYIENNKRHVSLRHLPIIAETFNITIDDLFR